ncbi:hypothetical protein [Burkholderia ubonensis]|uniref:hypothetical protein n=1 Tax=Burkholderia ubonensis TaxID=101571 RepID=UPI000BA504F0|nr:hypothetical protein [Burkholderia ubonensis]PAK14926.1 hypothetical protein CJO66_09210 [Burkholderia ubonensis]
MVSKKLALLMLILEPLWRRLPMSKKSHRVQDAMVIRIAFLTLVLLLNRDVIAGALSDWSSPSKTAGLVAPESVEIAKNGAWSEYISGDEMADTCRSFVLRQTDVSAFFKHASRVTEREYSHDLVAANCYAEGKAHLVDGGTATWKIDQARRGFVSMPDGSTIYVYCPKCRANVFAPN